MSKKIVKVRISESKKNNKYTFWEQPKEAAPINFNGTASFRYKFQKQTNKRFSLSFEKAVFLWLESIRWKIKPQTYTRYKFIINKHIIEDLKEINIEEINSTYINEFLYLKSENGSMDLQHRLSHSYLKTIAYIIKSTIDFAIDTGFRSIPLGKIYIPSLPKKEIKTFTETEVKKLETFLIDNIDLSKAGILLALNTGLRLGELCGIKWDDFDFCNATIKISRTVQRIQNIEAQKEEKKTSLIISSPKSFSSKREIPIPQYLLNFFEKERGNRKSEFVFAGRFSEFIDPRTYQYRFEKYLKQCNIRKLNFHALRHTFATRCVNSGVENKTLSEILGHHNVVTSLNFYVHPSLEQKRAQLELATTQYHINL